MNTGSYCNVFANLYCNRIGRNMHQWSGASHPENEFEYSGIIVFIIGNIYSAFSCASGNPVPGSIPSVLACIPGNVIHLPDYYFQYFSSFDELSD